MSIEKRERNKVKVADKAGKNFRAGSGFGGDLRSGSPPKLNKFDLSILDNRIRIF